jgi:hypothetical protein
MTFETNQKVLAEDQRTWNCSLLAKGYTSQTDIQAKQDAEEVDICPFMRYGATMYPSISMDPLSYFMFDPKEVQGSSKDNILKMQQFIQSICREGGFYASPTNHCVRKPGKKYLALLELKCEHNQPVLPQDKTVLSVPRHIRTKKPLSEEDKCPFVIRVFCHKRDSCWYLNSLPRHHSCDPCLHKGHHKLMPCDICIPRQRYTSFNEKKK